jgi:hypothetical protein
MPSFAPFRAGALPFRPHGSRQIGVNLSRRGSPSHPAWYRRPPASQTKLPVQRRRRGPGRPSLPIRAGLPRREGVGATFPEFPCIVHYVPFLLKSLGLCRPVLPQKDQPRERWGAGGPSLKLPGLFTLTGS